MLIAHYHAKTLKMKHELREQQSLEERRVKGAVCEKRREDLLEANIRIGEILDNQEDQLLIQKEEEVTLNMSAQSPSVWK